MTTILVLMAWTLLLAVGTAYFQWWYLNRAARKATAAWAEDSVVDYMAALTPEQVAALGEKVFEARMP